MSRWLWALLGGVVLVAIAAAFWTASNRTNVSPPVSPEPTAVAPAPVPPAPPAPAPVATEPAPRAGSAPTAQEARPPAPLTCGPGRAAGRNPARPRAAPAPGAPPAPPVVQAAPAPLPAAPNPAPNAGQQAASPPALAPRPSASSAPPVVAQKPPSAPAAPVAEPPLPQPAPGREAQQVAGVFAPKNLAQLVGAWAYSEGDCDRLFQRRGGGWAFRQPVDKFAQAAIVESPKKILLPSATCRIDGASGADGALKVSAECEDSISYTPRSVMIALRSPTELIYSATGDPALATTLKKCAP